MNDTGPARTTGGVMFAAAPFGYVVAGLDVDDASVTLRVLVQDPADASKVRRRLVVLPLCRGRDDLIVGTPKILDDEEE